MNNISHNSCKFLLPVAVAKLHVVLDRLSYLLAMLQQHPASKDRLYECFRVYSFISSLGWITCSKGTEKLDGQKRSAP